MLPFLGDFNLNYLIYLTDSPRHCGSGLHQNTYIFNFASQEYLGLQGTVYMIYNVSASILIMRVHKSDYLITHLI